MWTREAWAASVAVLAAGVFLVLAGAEMRAQTIISFDEPGYDDLVIGNVVVQPSLSIRLVEGPTVIVSWPGTYSGYLLEAATALFPTTPWEAVSPGPELVGSDWTVTTPAAAHQRLFRLRHPFKKRVAELRA